MEIWEGTELIINFNVEGQDRFRRLRFVNVLENPQEKETLAFGQLLLGVLPEGHQLDSVQMIQRRRYL